MTRADLLLEKSKTNPDYALNCWAGMGEFIANSKTKFYPAGQVIRVDASSGDWRSSAPLHNSILYVNEEYRVDNKARYPIDWSVMTPDDLEGTLVSVEGVMLPYFTVLPVKWSASFTPENDFIPFEEADEGEAEVNISDSELMLCLTDLGMPFLTWDEIEYNRNQIVNLCVKPALDEYWTYFPIIVEDGSQGSYSKGGEFKVPMPANAYSAVPYFVSGVGAGGSGQGGGSPFTFFNETMLWSGGSFFGMGSSRFGRGVYYPNKQTPGFTGQQGRWSSMFDNLAVAQALRNYMRHEKYSIVKEDGVKYVKGFSTIGGALNIKWLCKSPDWDDVKYEHLEPLARPMVKIRTLKAIKAVRDLVKTDTNGALQVEQYLAAAEKLEEKIKPLRDAISTGYALSIMRSGSGQ
jgi:hypothetical protein